MKNKSVLALLMAVLMLASLLAGCGAKNEAPAAQESQTEQAAPQ